jgi:hypothetical protein
MRNFCITSVVWRAVMKRKLFFTAKFGVALALGLVLLGCPGEDEGDSGPAVINIAAIAGVTAPVTGATPVATITPSAQYTGTVTWAPAPPATGFVAGGIYTATITLTAASGYTLTGVAANFFTVAGTSSPATNAAGSGIVTAVFPGATAGGGGGQQSGAPTVTVLPSVSKILVSWNEVSGATGYQVVWARADDVPTTLNAGNSIELGADKRAYTISNAASEEYGIWVRAKGADGSYGSYCERKAVTPTANVGDRQPARPEAPMVTPTDNGQLKIVWADTQWATTYIVKVGTNADDRDGATSYPNAQGTANLEYTTTTLASINGLNYYVWVGANNANATTWSTPAVSGTILDAPATGSLNGTTWKIQGSSAQYVFTSDSAVTFTNANSLTVNGTYTYAKPTLTLTINETATGLTPYEEWDGRNITIQGKTFKTGATNGVGGLEYARQ